MISLPVTPGRADAFEQTGLHAKPEGRPFKHVEIQINQACDLDCFGCDRFSDVVMAPNMTVEQVRLFAQETVDLGWEWERIRLLGGEPTLHPQFWDIVEVICGVRRSMPKCFLQVLSNGRGKLEQYRSMLLDRGIDPHVEGKEPGVTPAWFANTRIAPVDRDPTVGELPPCGIFGERGCGVALTRNGFFLDGAGASAAMVAGHDIGVMRLADVTWEAMLDQARVLCRICGHWNGEHEQVTKKVSETGEVTGAYWTEKLAAYRRGKPSMRIYGED